MYVIVIIYTIKPDIINHNFALIFSKTQKQKKLLFFNGNFTIIKDWTNKLMKFKTPSIDFIKISIDRLTRFKPVSEKYKRVFDEILNKHFIPNGQKLSDLTEDERLNLAEKLNK